MSENQTNLLAHVLFSLADRFPAALTLDGPITTVYLIWSEFDMKQPRWLREGGQALEGQRVPREYFHI